MMNRILLIFCSLILLAHPTMAGTDTGADFLKIPVGARSVSLGQADTAMARGVQSLNGNPAGISNIPAYAENRRMGLLFSHQELFLDTNLDHLGLVAPATMRSRTFNWGLSVTRVSYADQEGRAADRSTTGSFGTSDLSLGAALATRIGNVQVGSHVKYIRQDLAGIQAQGMALDLGFLSSTPVRRLSLGGAVRNLGPKMKFIEEEFNLPLTLSVGAAYQVIGPMTMGLDITSRPYQDEVSVAVGTEFQAINIVTLRAGYLARVAAAIANNQKSETNRGNLGGLNGMTAGLGLQLKEFSLDYALAQFGELGLTHTLSLSTWFGGKTTAAIPGPLSLEAPIIQEEPIDPATQPDPNRLIIIFEEGNLNWWTTR